MTLLNRAIPAQDNAACVLNYPSDPSARFEALTATQRFLTRYFTLTLMKKEDVCRLQINNA